MEKKVGPLKRSTKLTNLQLTDQQKKREGSITDIRNERGSITTCLGEIKRIIREYYEYFYVNKLDNLDEMDKFLETHKLLKVTQEEVGNLKESVTSKKRLISNQKITNREKKMVQKSSFQESTPLLLKLPKTQRRGGNTS